VEYISCEDPLAFNLIESLEILDHLEDLKSFVRLDYLEGLALLDLKILDLVPKILVHLEEFKILAHLEEVDNSKLVIILEILKMELSMRNQFNLYLKLQLF
jgi:hypothetical protein